MKKTERAVRCKYCGARLKRDIVGPYCPTDNCQWSQGLPSDEGGLETSVMDSVERSAELSECGRYRWLLERWWGAPDPGPGNAGKFATWIMLNPSTADANKDDNTIRRCMFFSKTWGMAGMKVVNLFAYRATRPADLDHADVNIVGSRNDHYIKEAIEGATWIVAAWGAHKIASARITPLLRLISGRSIWCLDKTKNGSPKHPLYVPGNTKLKLFRSEKAD